MGQEIGAEGLSAYSGIVSEAYISQLEWPGCYHIYNEMRRRDPTLKSLILAIKLLGRQADWKAEPVSDGAADKLAAEFVDECLGDMSHTIEDAIDDALTFLPFGWSSFEICYKRREGAKGKHGSKFADGKVGWRKWAFRRQSSHVQWLFDGSGGLQGWIQMAAPSFRRIPLPIEKLLHFTAERDGNNPEGMSLFEAAYEPWHFVKNLQVVSGIGWQRAFVGLPVFEYQETPSPEDEGKVKRVGQGLTVDERQYVAIPPLVKFKLESVANTGAASLLDTIRYYRTLMLQIVLADFIMLGTTQTGSWALGQDKSELFLMAVNGYLDRISQVLTAYGVPRLLAYNPMPGIAGHPRITHSEVRKPRLEALSQFLRDLAPYVGMGPDDILWVRQQAGMPVTEAAGAAPTKPPEPETGGLEGEEGLAESWGHPTEWAELQEGGQDEGRAQIEQALGGEIAKALKGEKDALFEALQAYPQGPPPAWWDSQHQGLWQRLLRALLDVIDDITRLVVDEAVDNFGGAPDWEAINQAALAWAQKHAGQWVSGVSETTRALVRAKVSAWIETGAELPELTKALEPIFGRERAERIASTEITNAFAAANDAAWQQMGLPGHEYRPAAHVRCRCYTRPLLLADGVWVTVWASVKDERVCTRPIKTPWGVVNGCRDLQGMVVSKGPYSGLYLREAQSKAKKAAGK